MKNIIKILVFLISVVTYAQVQPVNYYQQFNKVNKANENDSIQVLVRTVGNPDHNIVKYVSASDIGGGGSGQIEIPDWQSQFYSQGDIVSHNGGIWRSEVDNNEDEPIECVESSWEEIEPIILDRFIVLEGSELYFDFSYQSFFNNITKEEVLDDGSNQIGLTIDEGDRICFVGEVPVIGIVNTTINPSDSFSTVMSKIDIEYIITPFITPNPMITCELLLTIGSGFGFPDAVYIDDDGAKSYKLVSCPLTDFPTESSCSWTLLAQVNEEGGDFMTLNSENSITEDWNINDGDFTFIDRTSVQVGTDYNNYVGFMPGSIYSKSEEQSATLLFPNSGIEPYYLPVSVNGEFADEYGNIEIEAGGGELVQITEGGNTGWGLKYRADNPDNYGNIGEGAIDLGFNIYPSSTIGATGLSSTVSGGEFNTASGTISTVSGGSYNTTSGQYSTVSGGQSNNASGTISTVSGGSNNTASGSSSTVSGGQSNNASGTISTISGGRNNTANSYGEWVGGVFGTIPTGQNANTWVATDRLFNVGNGTSTSLRSDAFTILKNGLATLPSVTNTLIDAEPTGKAVATKEWVLANSGGGLTLEQARQNGSEVDGWIQFKGSTFTTGISFQAEVHQVQDRRISIKKDADDNLLISNYPNTNNEKAIIAVNHDGSIRMTVNPDDPTDKVYTFDNTGILSSTYNGASSNNHYVQRQYVSNNFIAKPTEGTSGQVLTTDGAGNYTWEDVEVQTYLQSITGYDAGETQTLKNISGVLTWVTD